MTSAYTVRIDPGVGVKKLSRVGKGVPDIYVACMRFVLAQWCRLMGKNSSRLALVNLYINYTF